MKMDHQNAQEYPREERFYEGKIRPKAPWRQHLWKMIAISALVAVVILAFAVVILWPKPSTVDPVQRGGTWQGQFTYYPGEPYSDPFQATLQIPSHQGNAFVGTLSEPFYGNSIVSVPGTEEGSSQLTQSQLQYVTQLYGNGTGMFISFTDPTYIQGSQIQLDCSYIALVDANGNLHGVWFYPGSTQPDGTFILNKIS